MSVFPHSWLSVAPSRTVVISGPHIQTLDTLTGHLVASTALWKGTDKDALLKSGPVRCASTDQSQRYLATAGDDKLLKVWELDSLNILNQRELPKKPTAIRFTLDAKTILVSDKFGDVFSYSLHHPVISILPTKRDEFSSHENPSGGLLVLGHASVLTTFLLTFDERYIITVDRDEHIRVSWFPQGYNIESYCLGHEKYVSAIHIPPAFPSVLVSGGGDPTLKFWDWMLGTITHEVGIFRTVEPYIEVRPSKKRRGQGQWDGFQGESKRRKKEWRRNGGHDTKIMEQDSLVNDESRAGENRASESTISMTEDGGESFSDARDAVLVVHKIDTLTSGNDHHHLIFSAVGATALFTYPYPDGSAPSSIQVFDFGCPVVDFVVVEDGYVWTLLDGEWTGSSDLAARKPMTRIVKFSEGKLVESVDNRFVALVSSLNSQCLVTATSNDLQNLDLYSPLSVMPKNAEVEHNPMDRDSAATPLNNVGTFEQPTSKKKLGRLRSKVLLSQVSGLEMSHAEDRERSRKRVKSGHGD